MESEERKMAKERESGFLSKEAVFTTDDIKMAVVDCPEWGGKVKIKGLTVPERAEVVEASKKSDGDMDSTMFALMSIVIGSVEPKFELVDLDKLKKKSFGVIDRIAKAIYEVSGIVFEEQAKAELKKK
jgi:hypothetical protein